MFLQKVWSLNTALSQALEQLCRHNEMTRNFEASMSSHYQKRVILSFGIAWLPALSFRLNLFYNEITELPESLGQLQKLRKLHLGAPTLETVVGFTLEVGLWWKKL